MRNSGEDSRDFQNSGTFFFRNVKLLQTFQSIVESNYAGKKVRVWNVGASVGAETYSIATFLQELLDRKVIADYEVIASDNSLEGPGLSQRNRYPVRLLQPDHRMDSLIEKYTTRANGILSFHSEIAKRIQIHAFNFNEPKPLGSAKAQPLSEVDFLFFNFSYSYAMPNQNYLHTLLEVLLGALSKNGVLVSNLFSLPWIQGSGFDLYHETALETLQ